MKGTENKQSHGITFVQSSSSKTLLAVKLVAAAVTLVDIGRHHIQGAMRVYQSMTKDLHARIASGYNIRPMMTVAHNI